MGQATHPSTTQGNDPLATMTEIPETRYVKSDDVHIAYQVLGKGPLDLLFAPGFVSHIEAVWRSPEASAFLQRLASFSRLILFDKRGTGMSDRGSHVFTLEQRMHDVQAILDEVGSQRAALFGVSEGGPMSLLYAASHPERTAALVLYGSYAKRAWAPDYPIGWKDEQWKQVLGNIEAHWGTPQGISIAIWAPSLAHDPQAGERMASYFRTAASPGAALAIMKMNRDIDVRQVLPAISRRALRSAHGRMRAGGRRSCGHRGAYRCACCGACGTRRGIGLADGARSRGGLGSHFRAARHACAQRCAGRVEPVSGGGGLKGRDPKQKHRRAALTGVELDLALFLGTRTQNAPSRIAPTIAKAAHTASTSSRKARSTSHPPFRGGHWLAAVESSKGGCTAESTKCIAMHKPPALSCRTDDSPSPSS
jgi:pimeloyl-ACP methyl ester carboxylesterase